MKARIAVIGGDGIGPEVTAEAVRVLRLVARHRGHDFTLTEKPFGGIAIDQTGDPLPADTLSECLAADAVLLGAIGGPKWSDPKAKVRPEQGLLRLRKELGVYANLRPVRLHPALRDASTLKPEVLDGVDLIFVRELIGGIYFGTKTRTATDATDLCSYSVPEIERIVEAAAQAGAHAIHYTIVRLPWEVKPLFQEWLDHHVPERAARIMARIRDLRGGRDYDARFGQRMKGQGVWGELIRQRVRSAAARHGLGHGGPVLDSSAFDPGALRTAALPAHQASARGDGDDGVGVGVQGALF